MKEKIEEDEEHCFYMIPISNKDLSGIDIFKEEIYKIVSNTKLCPMVHRLIPKSWKKLEDHCKNLAKTLRSCPIISLEQLFKNFQNFETKEEMATALLYITSTGSILFSQSIENMDTIVILDPDWLIQLLKLVFIHNANETFKYDKGRYKKYFKNEEEYAEAKQYLLSSGHVKKDFLK